MTRAPDQQGFGYHLVLCPDFDTLLAGKGEPPEPDDDLTGIALRFGRVLLQARGGAGKTFTMQRAAEAVADAMRSAAVVRVTGLTFAGKNDAGSVSEELLALTAPDVTVDLLRGGAPCVIMVDGLNEAERSLAEGVLAAADLLASRHPNLGVVVSDRLVRRDVPTDTWALATLTKVPDDEVRRLTNRKPGESFPDVLTNPYYLENARRSPDEPVGPAMHERFLIDHGGVRPEDLERLTAAAYGQYDSQRSRILDLGSLRRDAGDRVVDALLGAQVVGAEELVFRHHLIHDYLAARHVAQDASRWDRDTFDVLTFGAASFDALGMVLQQTALSVDLLVRRVHDWNMYGAAHLLVEDRGAGRRVGSAMRLELLGSLAARRFDRVSATAQQVSDALRIDGSDLAQRLLHADSLAAILRVVAVEASALGSDEIREWLALFGRESGAPAADDDLAALREADSLLGWTASNVLKRLVLSEKQRELLLAQTTDDNDTLRWRAVHVLGAHPHEGVKDRLLTVLSEDPDVWVRYGALRSLVEIAASTDRAERDDIFQELASRAGAIAEEPRLLKEVERALPVDEQPADWADSAGLLLQELWARSETAAEQDRWRRVSARLRLGRTARA